MAGPADAPLSGAGQNFAFHPLPRFRLFQILSLAGILRRTKPRILHSTTGTTTGAPSSPPAWSNPVL